MDLRAIGNALHPLFEHLPAIPLRTWHRFSFDVVQLSDGVQVAHIRFVDISNNRGSNMFGSKLGKPARDRVSGFTGIITARCEYLYAGAQYQITAPSNGGEFNAPQWFDEGRVEMLPDPPQAAAA